MALRLRPKQQAVIDYTGGRMGVSAVPGSGKTYTLSALAAHLVASGRLADDQEVLIVTLVNSAVDHFAARVAHFIRERGLLPNLGYRVRTLHGLAHDIVRERPSLVGLADDFQICDERESGRILRQTAEEWVRHHPDMLERFIEPTLDAHSQNKARRKDWPDLVVNIAKAFIRQAKDWELTPADLHRQWESLTASEDDPALEMATAFSLSTEQLPLVEMALDIYTDYQRALTYQGVVDFDDLIRLAMQALRADAAFLERLRYQWPFILEDEAQDSSRLQEEILGLLVGPAGNWVRVGDPNQAIYETFTTASPRYLRDFLQQPGVIRRDLSNSGRSTDRIIRLANYLIDWTREQHPVPPLREALTLPHIEPTPPGDPQPNPPDHPDSVRIIGRKFSPEEELRAVVDSLARWLPEHPDWTVAVLTPRNQRGFEVADALKQRGIPYVELLRSTISTREAAGVLANVVNYLADPASSVKLATVYRVWQRDGRDDVESADRVQRIARAIRRCRQVEDFLWPRASWDWLASEVVHSPSPGARIHKPGDNESAISELATLCAASPETRESLLNFRHLVRRWQAAALLPIDQLILTLAQDLFQEPADLAIAHKLAVLLRQISARHPEWQLPDLVTELAVIARNERRFLGLGRDDTGFDPEKYRGQVVVATVHKAKGLEWDRVYLMAVNNYNFPSALQYDAFIAERWFIRKRLNLEAEVLAQLEALHSGYGAYEEGKATQDARLEYAAERLRLLYVGITRARRELIITWNTGRRGDQQPAIPFVALQTFWVTTQADG